jgi:hypothetical protein
LGFVFQHVIGISKVISDNGLFKESWKSRLRWSQLWVRYLGLRYILQGFVLTRSSRDHVKELNNVRPKQPFFFLKPTSSIVLNNEPVLRPKGINLHFEVELAVILGKQVKDLQAEDEKGAIDAIECKFTIRI